MGSLPVVVPANLESPTSTPLNRDAVSFHKQLDSSGRLLISGHPASDAWSLLNGSQTPNCVLVGFEICVSDSDIRRDSSSNFSETEYTFEIMAVAVKQGVTVKPNDVLCPLSTRDGSEGLQSASLLPPLSCTGARSVQMALPSKKTFLLGPATGTPAGGTTPPWA